MNTMRPKNKLLKVNGIKLHYVDWGNPDRTTLLLLHGFTGHARVWDYIASAMKKDYHVIALSQRGHGDSEWSSNDAYTIDDHFTDLVRFIERLRLKNLILAGHSMGGRNALFYTACLPEKVKKLILIDSRPGNNPQAKNALKNHISNFPVQAKSYNEISKVAQRLYPYLPDDICLHMAKHGFKKQPDGMLIPKFDFKMSAGSKKAGYVAEELWPFLGNIICPTLIVRGKESNFLSVYDAERMSQMIPNAIFKEIPNSTHLPVQENPQVFNKIALEFLNDQIRQKK